MRVFRTSVIASILTAAAGFAAMASCGGDDSDKPTGTSTGSAGASGAGGSTTTDGMGGSTTTEGGGGAGGATGGTAGAGGDAGGVVDGGSDAPVTKCDLSGTGLPHMAIPNPTGTMTLTSDKVWDLSDTTYVADGQTLTIEPCTRIEGAKSPLGTLVVSRGGKIMADGKAKAPILFTSKAAVGS